MTGRHAPTRGRRWHRWAREVGFWLLVAVAIAWLWFFFTTRR